MTRVRRRLALAIEREGFVAFARRQSAWAVSRLVERARIITLSHRTFTSDGDPVFLMISHNCGGGTEQHLRDLCARCAGRISGPWSCARASAAGCCGKQRDDNGRVVWCRESSHHRPQLRKLLATIRPVHAHVHHTMGVPDALIELLGDLGISYDWTIHDYYGICPRINLVGADQSYCGEPDEAGCNRCLAAAWRRSGAMPSTVSIEDWRAAFARRLSRARRVYVPSADVRDRLARYFPALPVLVRPHPETLPEIASLAARLEPERPVRVAVVGTITAVKGSDRLLDCATRCARTRAATRVSCHRLDRVRTRCSRDCPTFMSPGVIDKIEVYSRLAAARCHLAFLPSLWPESFMYTLSVVMASGLYTVCFDLGAQSSRLKSWGWGRVHTAGRWSRSDQRHAAGGRASGRDRYCRAVSTTAYVL